MNEKQTDNFAIILTQIRYVLRGQEPLEWPDSVRFDDLTPSAMVTLNLDSLKSRIDDLMNDLSRHSIPPHVTLVAGYVSALAPPKNRVRGGGQTATRYREWKPKRLRIACSNR